MKQIFITNKGYRPLETAVSTPADNELQIAVYTSVISTGTETMGMKKGDMSLKDRLNDKKRILDKVRLSINKNGVKATFDVIKSKLSSSERSIVFQPVGYSNSGIIVAKGRMVRNFNVGDRVACAGSGFAAHAEFATIPVNLAVKIPNSIDFDSAGFTTIGAIAMQGIRRANVTFGETVIITGLGLLGLIAVQIAKAWGLVVIGTDMIDKRLDLATELGADFCLKANDTCFIEKVKEKTNGHGADAVIIYAATKSSGPANQALDACRKKGRVVVVGAIGMDLMREAMYNKELDFVMSTSYGPGRYDETYELKGIDYPIGHVRWTENRNMMEFVRLLANDRIKVKNLISNRFNMDQVEEAYQILIENPEDNIACIFNYFHEEKDVPVSRMEIIHNFRKESKIGVGIIGAGSFIQRNHLANIQSMPDDYQLIGIAEKTPASAKTMSEKYKINYVTTDYNQLLMDPNIDLIVIGTRHNLHARQVCDSIKAGKNTLVEKPLAMNHEELSMIERVVEETPNVLVTVGFNRRYSPLIQKAKSIIKRNGYPVVINYRVNAGYFPPDIWIQDLEEGGGRIVGEVCHFIDLISYLSSSKIKELNSVHVPVNGKKIESEDNLIVTIEFENGSIGVLTYISIGGKEMEKERIEIFSNNSSLVIYDFINLQTFNCVEKGIKLKQPDKGHKALIHELSKKIRNEESLILPFKTDIEMTRLTLQILDQIHGL